MNIKQTIKQIFLLSLLMLGSWAYAIRPYDAQIENIEEIIRLLELESVTIEAVRADDQTPVSFSNMSQAEIQRLNNATNIPVLLQLMPSVVATTENGTAMGNTSFRIRGVDASRINVTLNGLPLNNPASQEVFWVNLPNLAGFLNSVQIQRGVGTSTTGSSAFGASINLETNTVSPRPTLDFSTTLGSFNTFAANVSASSGLLQNGVFAEGNFSMLNSDGYVRNGFSNHHSAYFSAGLVRSRHFLRFNYLYGNQKTGITWRGATEEQLEQSRRFNQDGFMRVYDEDGNRVYFDNESDNYRSHILQAFYTFRLSDNLRINAGFNYTHGFGYFETFRPNVRLRNFGFPDQTVDGVTYQSSDVIRRQFMQNDFYAVNLNFLYTRDNLNVTVGGHYNFYDGVHFGRLPYVRLGENILQIQNWHTNLNQDWYRNYIQQSETSAFVKFNYTFFNRFNAFVDLQYRFLTIAMNGTYHEQTWRNLQNELEFSETFSFFNPKFGISFQPNRYQRIFASVAQSSRTPTRADFRNAFVMYSEWGGEMATMRPEHLTNFEIGYQINRDRWAFGSNIYFMNYRNQLMPNGRTSESGSALMDNVERSYRLGLELTGGFRLNNWLRADANLTLSQNRIQEYAVTRHLFDNNNDWNFVGFDTITYRNVDLAYSPNVVGAGILTFTPIKNLNIMLTGKYVGRQYFDNFSTRENRLDAYFVSNLSVRYEFPFGRREGRIFYVQAFVNNLFNADYISNAYSWSSFFRDEPTFTERRFFVQAPIHFSIKLGMRL
ncbi:MAG: TonB-dependent receptor [Bacteroidales bacterium]|nr:TonB-dependent receptor [Bacteroidales bacterium]